MTLGELNAAIGSIDDKYLDIACTKAKRNSKKQITNQHRGNHVMRRISAGLVAALIFLLCSTTIAFAVSAEFREFVFTFLGITEPENVPEIMPESESTPDGMVVGDQRITLGGIIEGTYTRYPLMSSASNGVFKVCTDDVQMNSGNHYDAYHVENGEIVQLEEHLFKQSYHILGNDVLVEFEWAEHDGNVTITYSHPDAPFYMPGLAGDSTSTLIMLGIDPPGKLTYTLYPVLINVRTGEMTDICAGLGIENLPEILNSAISEDLSKMLLVDWDENIYYADLASRKLYHMDDLLGKKVNACVLKDGQLVCWTTEAGAYSVYSLDPVTLEPSIVYTGDPAFIMGFNNTFLYGNMYLGTSFAVEVDSDRAVTVIDLTNGNKMPIEGFQWSKTDSGDTECIPSADGDKLLIYTREIVPGTDPSREETVRFTSVGVLDFPNRTYIAFNRENMNLVSERHIYWFDNDSVIIETTSENGSTERYIYTLLDSYGHGQNSGVNALNLRIYSLPK